MLYTLHYAARPNYTKQGTHINQPTPFHIDH